MRDAPFVVTSPAGNVVGYGDTAEAAWRMALLAYGGVYKPGHVRDMAECRFTLRANPGATQTPARPSPAPGTAAGAEAEQPRLL